MITALILVRKGSRRLPNKNILPFGAGNLLTHKIKQLKQVSEIDSIVVSSDSDEMLDMARELDCVIHKRAPEYCDEKTLSYGAVIAHICENISGDDIIRANCTSPLVGPEDYKQAIKTYRENLEKGFDSLATVREFKEFLWEPGKGPLNYELGEKQVPSQELPLLYLCNGGINIAPRIKMIEWKYMTGLNPYLFVLDKRKAIDIDDIYDFECAKAWLNLQS